MKTTIGRLGYPAWWPLALGWALVAALVVDAKAVVVPQRGIAGLRLGMTREQVREKIGPPDAVVRPRPNARVRFVYRRRGLRVDFTATGRRGAVVISTTNRRERTRSGVGVGSSEESVRRRLRGIRCDDYLERGVPPRLCWLGVNEPIRTWFAIKGGRVVQITVQLVPATA